MSDSTLSRVCQVVADVLGVPADSVNAQTSYENVNAWDSLNIVKLVMAVESEFEVAVSPDDAVSFTSVAAIVQVLDRQGAGSGHG
jgi:acyl carrier protein